MFKLIDSLNHFILIFSMFSQCLLMTPAVPAGADILKKVSLCVRPQPLAAKRAKGNPFLMKTGVFLLLTLALAAIQCAAQSTIVPYTFTTIAGELDPTGERVASQVHESSARPFDPFERYARLSNGSDPFFIA